MTIASLSRRELLRFGAVSLGGLSLVDQLRAQALANTSASARHCIFVFLNGGPAHLDTFDMKPDAPVEIRGPYRPIATSAPGVRITEKLPLLAQLAAPVCHPAFGHAPVQRAQQQRRVRAERPLAGERRQYPPHAGRSSDVRIRGGPGATEARRHAAVRPDADASCSTWVFPPPAPAAAGWAAATIRLPAVRNRMMARSPEWEGKLPIPEGLGSAGRLERRTRCRAASACWARWTMPLPPRSQPPSGPSSTPIRPKRST